MLQVAAPRSILPGNDVWQQVRHVACRIVLFSMALASAPATAQSLQTFAETCTQPVENVSALVERFVAFGWQDRTAALSSDRIVRQIAVAELVHNVDPDNPDFTWNPAYRLALRQVERELASTNRFVDARLLTTGKSEFPLLFLVHAEVPEVQFRQACTLLDTAPAPGLVQELRESADWSGSVGEHSNYASLLLFAGDGGVATLSVYDIAPDGIEAEVDGLTTDMRLVIKASVFDRR
jgi:hypothetical protein